MMPQSDDAVRPARLAQAQWLGYADYCERQSGTRLRPTATELTDAFERGRQGQRPDADALAAARVEGYRAALNDHTNGGLADIERAAEQRGRAAVLQVLRDRHAPLAASEWHTTQSHIERDLLAAILRECGVSEETGGE